MRLTLFHDYMLNLSGRILAGVVSEGENLPSVYMILVFGRVDYSLNIYHTNTPYFEPEPSFPRQYKEGFNPTPLSFFQEKLLEQHLPPTAFTRLRF